MTLKEKVAKERPEFIGKDYPAGVRGCPIHYAFLNMTTANCFEQKNCEACWNREYIEPDEPHRSVEEKHENECRQIAHYSDELKQCKRLLRKALRTLDKKTNSCIDCAKVKSAPCEICEWVWNRREEALKLLGEDELI